MKILALLSLVISVPLVIGQDRRLSQVKTAFDDANIPRDLSIPFDPQVLLEVTFPQPSSRPITLKAGVQLPRNATAGPPKFSVVGKGAGEGPFVVAAVDPDAPTPQNPTSAQIRHFLGGNFAPKARKDGSKFRFWTPLTNQTAAISNFRQPTPPAGSDPHRYVFLLFKQPANFDQQTVVNATTPVQLFNISSFAEAVGLGNPLAGTFMLVGPDPST